MKSITVEPKTPGTPRWEDITEPDLRNGSVLEPKHPAHPVFPRGANALAGLVIFVLVFISFS